MGSVARIAFVLGALATASAGAAATASCSHGDYDGSYEGGVDTGAGDAGAPATTRTVQPTKNETITTDDGALQIMIQAGTFDAPATITISAAGEQTLDNGLIVPIYAVSGPEPKKPLLVVFTGSGTDNLPSNRALVPSMKQAEDSFALLKVAGGGTKNGGGGSNGPLSSFWGLSKSFGSFSLSLTSGDQAAAFVDISPTSCTAKCCPPSTSGSGNVVIGAVAGSCYCGGTTPGLACLVTYCGDVEAAAARCDALGASSGASIMCPQLGCTGSSCQTQPCSTGGFGQPSTACCLQSSAVQSQCLNQGQSCPATGLAVHCTDSAQCTTGVCCLVGNETLCAPSCPGASRVCTDGSQCADAGVEAGDGGDGGCSPTARCGFGTCGQAPAMCR